MLLFRPIVHVIRDDSFIPQAIEVFETAAPGLNSFVVIGPPTLTTFLRDGTFLFSSEADFKKAVSRSHVLAVVIHYLDSYNQKVVLPMVPPSKKIWWIGFGGDYYPSLLPRCGGSDLLLPSTATLVRELNANRSSTLEKFRLVKKAGSLNSWINLSRRISRLPQHFLGKDALSRIDFFSPVLESEFHMITASNPAFRPKYLPWNYGTFEDELGGTVRPSEIRPTKSP